MHLQPGDKNKARTANVMDKINTGHRPSGKLSFAPVPALMFTHAALVCLLPTASWVALVRAVSMRPAPSSRQRATLPEGGWLRADGMDKPVSSNTAQFFATPREHTHD